jgi:dolichol-phosphate mannosyltransferase
MSAPILIRMNKLKLISILTPVYCEEKNIKPFYEAVCEIAAQLSQYSWEFVFVNDGSKDNTYAMLSVLAARDYRCKIIDLSRNFGKEIALSAGITLATGDAVICIDSDLQHPPNRIPEMLKAWENGAEVVEMVRKKTENEPFMRILGSRAFYMILNRLSDVRIIPQTTDFRLLDRKVVEALSRIDEKQRMFRGLVDWAGFRKVQLEFVANMRNAGVSVYSYSKLINLALDSFISYSSLPLKLIGLLGVLITFFCTVLLTFMLLATAVASGIFAFTTLAFVVVGNTLLIGIVLCALGLMSLYLSKIYAEVQNRPLFLVRETLNIKNGSHPSGVDCYTSKVDATKNHICQASMMHPDFRIE